MSDFNSCILFFSKTFVRYGNWSVMTVKRIRPVFAILQNYSERSAQDAAISQQYVCFPLSRRWKVFFYGKSASN